MLFGDARSLALDGFHERSYQVVGIVVDGEPRLERERTSIGDDVDAGPTGDRAAVEGHLRLADRPVLRLQLVEHGEQSRGNGDGTRLAVRQAGVRGCRSAHDLVGQLAHVTVRRSHHGRFADHDQIGTNVVALCDGSQRMSHAETTDLFVERQCDVQRTFQLDAAKAFDRADDRGDEALHVGGAAAVQRVADLRDRVRIACPADACGHHIGMTRQHQAARFARAE